MKAKILTLVLSISVSGFGAQIPLFSTYRYSPFLYNPAYAGFDDKYTMSLQRGSSINGITNPEGFKVKRQERETDILNAGIVQYPNYLALNLSAPILKKNKYGIGLAFSYWKNGLNKLETANIFVLSLAMKRQLTKGRIGLGINFKRNSIESSSDVIQSSLSEPVFFSDYKQIKNNIDLGVVYSNDSQTFDFGLAVINLKAQKYSANSNDSNHILYFNSRPQLVFNLHYTSKMSNSIKLKNDIIAAVNDNFKYGNYIARSTIYYKHFGAGIQFHHRFSSLLGPAIGYSGSTCDIMYIYSIDLRNSLVIAGFHEFGIKVKF